jgi:hypothetical protein
MPTYQRLKRPTERVGVVNGMQDSAKAAQQGILLPQHAAYRTFTPTVVAIAAGAFIVPVACFCCIANAVRAIVAATTRCCLAVPVLPAAVILAMLCAFVEYEEPHLTAGQISQYYK